MYHIFIFVFVHKKSVYNPTLQRPSSNLSAGLHLPVSLSRSLFTQRRSVCSTRANAELCRVEEIRRRCTYHTVGDCESVPDAMYAIVMETFQVTV